MTEPKPPNYGYRCAAKPLDLRGWILGRKTMRRTILLLFGLIVAEGCIAAAPADGIYLCTDADGHKTYQNSSDGAACHRVDGLVATIPSSELPRGASPRPARASISPASFPRVDINTQRMRDTDRRHILEEELHAEEEHLARLRAEFNHGEPAPAADELIGSVRYRDRVQRLFEDIERSEGNVASLRRELTPVRY